MVGGGELLESRQSLFAFAEFSSRADGLCRNHVCMAKCVFLWRRCGLGMRVDR